MRICRLSAVLAASVFLAAPRACPAQATEIKGQAGTLSATLRHHIKGTAGGFNTLALSADGEFVAAGTLAGKAFMWEVKSGKEKIAIDCGGMFGAMAISPDGGRLAVGVVVRSAKTHELQAWDNTGRNIFKLGRLGSATGIAFQPDGKRIATHAGRGLQLRDALDGTVQKSVETGQFLGELDINWAAKVIATAGSSDERPRGSVKLWHADSLEPIRTLKGHDAIVRGVSLSPSAERVATASNDGVLRIWDAKSGDLFLEVAHAGYAVAYSPDGKHIATTTKGKVTIRDANTGKEVLIIDSASALKIAFNRDGTLLATAGVADTGVVQIWEIKATKQAQKDK